MVSIIFLWQGRTKPSPRPPERYTPCTASRGETWPCIKGGRRLASLQWHQDTSIEVRFRGHKGDQAQQGSVIVRTRDDASGTRSGVGAGGGAVALMVELLSVYPTMPESAPLSSYRCGNEVSVWRYPEPLRHYARWQRGQEMILAKTGSTHCVSVQPLRWRPGGRITEGDPERR